MTPTTSDSGRVHTVLVLPNKGAGANTSTDTTGLDLVVSRLKAAPEHSVYPVDPVLRHQALNASCLYCDANGSYYGILVAQAALRGNRLCHLLDVSI